jgi:preprotein translocase SecF subunit
MLRVLHGTKIDFIRLWKVSAIAVAAFLLPALIMIVTLGFRVGIEFTGGTFVQLKFNEAPNVSDVRQVITSAGFGGSEVTTFGSPTEIAIRARGEEVAVQATAASGAVTDRIRGALEQRYGAGSFTVQSTQVVGPRVGSELRRNALIAMMISFIVSLIYLAWRFDWRLSLASVLANVHDILATFAFIKYMNIEITLFVIGGILTVIGYSLADKVVVFDRVRELLRNRSRIPLRETLNQAVNETLPRTVMTGSTVLACLISLIALGGEVLRPFAWVLLFGIVIGTFSSIYVAGPLLLVIEKRWPRATSTDIRQTSSQGKTSKPPARPATTGAGSR